MTDSTSKCATAFADSPDGQTGGAVQRHIDETWRLMAEVGDRGFFSFVPDTDGILGSVDIAGYPGAPQAFQGWLRGQARSSVTNTDADAPAGDVNGCGI